MTIDVAEWVRWEALRLSKRAIKAQLRSRGDKLSEYRRCDLERLAKLWFDDHRPELAGRVLGDLLSERLTKLLSAARRMEADKSMASVVQMSSSKVEA